MNFNWHVAITECTAVSEFSLKYRICLTIHRPGYWRNLFLITDHYANTKSTNWWKMQVPQPSQEAEIMEYSQFVPPPPPPHTRLKGNHFHHSDELHSLWVKRDTQAEENVLKLAKFPWKSRVEECQELALDTEVFLSLSLSLSLSCCQLFKLV